MSETTAQEPEALAEAIVAKSLDEALAALAELGRSRDPAAAPVLLAVAESSAPKELRKEARRELHRLRGLGLSVRRPSQPTSDRPEASAQRQAELVEASASAPDGVGSRALWLLAERPLGGVYAVSMVLNDVVGMKACSVSETTRKRAGQRLSAWQADSAIPWVALPVEYAKQLIGEALELNRESGFTVPQDYQLYERAIGHPSNPFEKALVYEQVSATEVTLDPQLLKRSPALLDERELKNWFFGFDEVHRFALDLLQARQSQIVLSQELQAERQNGIIANAIRDVVTPQIQRALGRRLEEMAYLFLRTNRPRQAREAVAAAQRLSEDALTLHPFLNALMQRSLELAAEVEMAKVPVELARRSPYDAVGSS